MDAAVKDHSASAPYKHHYTKYTATPTPLPSAKPSSLDCVKEPPEYFAKYRIYERDFLRRINHKYFSGKRFTGSGRVYETIVSVDGFTVKESSEPPLKRFLEIPTSIEEHSQSGAPPAAKKPSRRKS